MKMIIKPYALGLKMINKESPAADLIEHYTISPAN